MTMQCTHSTNIAEVSVEHKALCSFLLCTILKAISHISQSELRTFSSSLSISFNSSCHSKCIIFTQYPYSVISSEAQALKEKKRCDHNVYIQ